MQLEQLRVVHQSKRENDRAPNVPEGAFFLETCQRKLWVSLSDPTPEPVGALSGEEAYLALLLVACGLSSELVGETDVFGQLKDAWRAFEAARPEAARPLAPILQKIYEDTKDIRARHLEGLGGASYGTLARRLISAAKGDKIVIVGAGRLARAVAPFFLEQELTVVNRTAASAAALAATLGALGAKAAAAAGPEAEEAAWREARHAVVCVPVTAETRAADEKRVALWRARSGRGALLHMGCLSPTSNEAGPWAACPELKTLDAVFALRSNQDEARAQSAQAARKACRERARLRALGPSLSVAHGWEDLASFL